MSPRVKAPPTPAICCSIWANVIAFSRAAARLAGVYGKPAVHAGSAGFIHAGVAGGCPGSVPWPPHVWARALMDARARATKVIASDVIDRFAAA